ncbi:MAG: tRNA (N6-isopentenyl adenosine(37)-C2)-methylthiotransferase MiaB [Cytophagales bacterium]
MSEVIGDIGILEQENEACETVKTSIEEDRGNSRKLYIESYGCQMNFSDSEIVTSILKNEGFDTTSKYEEADLILLNTCSIRDKAEQTIRKRLKQFNAIKRNKPKTQIAVLGCMAERLKKNLLEEEKIVDIVAGPDAYRDLPNLVKQVDEGDKAVNVFLSREETYADISPVRLNSNGVTAFVSIMRGCDNMCSFCVVPFTRGRERSRNPESILKEAQELIANGYKEVTLLGQNVDSYKWKNEDNGEILNFAQLLEKVALLSPELRIRFSTSHPKDITDEVLHTIARYENICNYIHLPAQSGNDRILKLMNRTYSREWYLERVSAIRRIIGDECGISSDMITGFCSETEEEHQDTLSLMKEVKYDFSYMFFYSERPGTLAAKNYSDDISLEVKKRRLAEIIALQSELSLERNKKDLGKMHKVLVEGLSKKSDRELYGRNSANKVVVFPKENYKIGQYVNVMVNDCSSATLLGKAVEAV